MDDVERRETFGVGGEIGHEPVAKHWRCGAADVGATYMDATF